MKRSMRMKLDGVTKNTSRYLPMDDPWILENFYPNSHYMASAGLGKTLKIILVVSTEKFADGEVDLAFPPVPFDEELSRLVRYRHTVERSGKERQATNTPELPVTLAYANKAALPAEFIARRRPIHFGVSALVEGTGRDTEVADETADLEVAAETSEHAAAEGVTGFDAFLTESVREEEGGRLTTRRVWRVWAEKWEADPDEQVIAGVQFDEVAGRVSEILGVTTAKDPTRVDGKSQRYWPGHAI